MESFTKRPSFRIFNAALLFLLFPILCFAQMNSPLLPVPFLPVGSRVKITLPKQKPIIGKISNVNIHFLILSGTGQRDTVKLNDIQRLWYRDRAAKKGAQIGAIAGALGMGTMITILAAVAAGETTHPPFIFIAVGGLLGAMGGGITGYAIGSAIPRWKLYYDVTVNPLLLPKAPIPAIARSRLGFIALLIGMGMDNGYAGNKGFLMERFQIGAYYHHRWILGPEVGFTLNNKKRLSYLGGIALYNFNEGFIDFYGTAGLGVYFWRELLTTLGASLGVLVKHRWSNGIAGLLEIRWHQNLQHLDSVNPAFFTILPGVSISW